MSTKKDFETFVRARYPIIYVVSWEERRVMADIEEVAKKLDRKSFVWTITQGLRPKPTRATPKPNVSIAPELEVLADVHEATDFGIFTLYDFHPYMKDHRVIRMLRDLSNKLRSRTQTLFIVSPVLALPPELEKEVTVVEYPLPMKEDIEKQLDTIIEAVSDRKEIESEIDDETREHIVHSAQGLTADEIESALARSLVEDRKFDPQRIVEEKRQIVRKSGILEFYPVDLGMADVGGHDLLKSWVQKRSKSFTEAARDFGIPYPKGILMIGVQGCGKSLVAKAVASSYALPMLKLDVGRVFGSLVGQSEQNMRKAIQIAESLAPCVLWIDELEKGFAGIGGSGISDSGTTARVFSTFLTWMQEKTKPVFIVATANDVSALPPELLRKGRFDEIFFIDLPELHEREEIFRIHLKKRKRDPANFNIPHLAEITRGFSGAEIEQVVIGALNHAFFDDTELEDKHMEEEAERQVPLSRMMSEEISNLREWAKSRARPSASPHNEHQAHRSN